MAQQVHKILVEEIHAGRWKVGTRLPGVIKICEQTGLGNKTIQEAFSLLKSDGYIQSEPNKGSYLTSILPREINPAAHRIGILLTDEQAETPYTLWLSHLFMDAALRYGLLGEVHIAESGSDWSQVVTTGNTFSAGVKSIISLVPFRLNPCPASEAEQRLPVLFLCHMVETCCPMVALDVANAYYELTQKVVLAGHTETVFLSDQDIDPRFTCIHRENYQAALRDAGLKGRAFDCRHSDPQQVEKLLKTLVSEKKVTALLSGSLQLTEQGILPASRKLKIKIPKQLSVLTLGSTKLPWNEALHSTGIELDFEHIARICFDLLNQFVMTGDCRQTKTLVKGKYFPGHTLFERALKNPG